MSGSRPSRSCSVEQFGRRAILQAGAAALTFTSRCTLVDDVIMRPGLIYARNVHNIAWNRAGTLLVGSDAPRSFIAVWDARTGATLWRHNLASSTASGPLRFVDRSTLIVSADPNDALSSGAFTPLLDAASGQLREDLGSRTAGRLAKAAANCLASSNDERLLALSYRKHAYVDIVRFGASVEVTRLGPVVDGLGRTGSTISFLCISPDNALVAIGFTWGEAQVWDIDRNLCVARFAAYGNTSLRGLSFAGPAILVSSSDGIRSVSTRQIIKVPGYRWAPPEADLPQAAVRSWDARSGEFIRSLAMLDESGTGSVTTTQSGSLAACVSRTQHLHVWRVADGTLVRLQRLPFVSSLDPDGDICFSPDETRIAAAVSSSVFVEHVV